uniref:Uncharacterized protein n=1 Tax=Solanum lycopersicum TaxID=4081 RepID=A0A3Q7FGT1_SOLLC
MDWAAEELEKGKDIGLGIRPINGPTSGMFMSYCLYVFSTLTCSKLRVESGKEFRELVYKFMEEFGKPNIVDFFPILRRMDPQGIRRLISIHARNFLKLFEGLIDECRKLHTNTRSNDNVLDVFLNVNQKDPAKGHKTYVPRTETTSNTVEWAMSEVMKTPEVMKKAQIELEKVIGKVKIIEERNVPLLPYLKYIVKETMRLHPPGPLFLRTAKQDVELCGYVIPKGSLVLIHVWFIARSLTIWEDPLGKDFELIPFGGGRRISPRLPLAMRTVLVKGEIEPKDLDMEEKFGLTLAKSRPLCTIPLPRV